MNARLRRICITGSIVLVSLIILLFIGYSQLIAYLQGDSFRSYLTDSARRVLRASDFDINSNLSINGKRVSVQGATLSGVNKIQEASASRISAEIDRAALLGRRLHISKLSMEEASLVLSSGADKAAAQPGSSTTKEKTKKKNTPRKAEATASSKGIFSLKEIQLNLFECKDTDLSIKHNDSLYQLLGANVSASPAPRIGRNAWQLNAENARLHTPFHFLRDSSIKTTTMVYHDDSVDVTECRIMLTPGEMRVKARYDIKQSQWGVDMQVNKGNLHRLLNEDWKKRVSGDLYGRLTMTGRGGSTVTGTGAFSLQNGVLEGLPFLSQLPIGNTYPYRSIELEKADCQLLFPYDSATIKNAWLIDKINLSSRDGSMLVQGHVLIGTDRSLGGTLNIGLPRNIVQALPLPKEDVVDKLFTSKEDDSDYLWVKLNLSGTLDQPKEDLSIRISTLAGDSIVNSLKNLPKGSAADLLNILLQQKSDDKPAEDTSESTDTTPESNSTIQNAVKAAGSLLQSLF